MRNINYIVKKETVNSFYIVDTPFDIAFSKAVETAMEMKLTIVNSDKNGGTFLAMVNSPFAGEVTNMNFILMKESDTKLKCILSVKSSKGNQATIDDFKAAYSKKVKISE